MNKLRRLVSLSTVTFLPSVASSATWFGDRSVLYRGEELTVLDMHLHTGVWDDLPDSFREQLQEVFPFPLNVLPDFLLGPLTNLVILSPLGIDLQLYLGGVDRGVLFAVYAPDTAGLTSNERVLKRVRRAPGRFRGLASTYTTNWPADEDDALDHLRTYLSEPEFVGVKMAHPHQGINLTDPTYYSIYGVAEEFDVPVYVHTGKARAKGSSENPEATHPAFLEEAVRAYPNVTFVLGHAGNGATYDDLEDPLEACLRLARTHSNVYVEASALGSDANDPAGEKLLAVTKGAKRHNITTKLLYGSDGPQFPGYVVSYLQNTLVALDRADYDAEEAADVLYRNFARVYGLED